MLSTKLPIYSKYEDGGKEISHPEYLMMSQRISPEWDQIMICKNQEVDQQTVRIE